MQEFINNPRYKHGAVWNSDSKFYFYNSNGKYLGMQCLCKIIREVCFWNRRHEISFNDAGSIRASDVVHVTDSEHWLVVLDRNGENLTTIEGNWDGKVNYSTTAYKVINGVL